MRDWQQLRDTAVADNDVEDAVVDEDDTVYDVAVAVDVVVGDSNATVARLVAVFVADKNGATVTVSFCSYRRWTERLLQQRLFYWVPKFRPCNAAESSLTLRKHNLWERHQALPTPKAVRDLTFLCVMLTLCVCRFCRWHVALEKTK